MSQSRNNKLSSEQLEKLWKKGKIPFALNKSQYQRFSERDMIFARVNWDSSYPAYGRPISERESQKVGKKGYSRMGYALQDAAWTVYDHFHDAFAWDPIQDPHQAIPTQFVSKLPKYKSTDPKENSKVIKRASMIFGACDTGICEIDPNQLFIYTHDRSNNPINFPAELKYAIVMLIEMDHYAIGTSPNLPAAIATGHAYSRMAFSIACMAEFLRNLGYKALPAGNNIGLSVPLAINAGLGQLGRNGLLIHPKYGQRVRICKVFTDFPLTLDSPIDFGVTDFCRVCKKCAKHCPSRSIPFDRDPTWESPWNSPSNNNGVYKWYVNIDKCYEFWVRNSTDCSNCIRVCPFTKSLGIIHDTARFLIKHFRFLNHFLLLSDNLLGYGKKKDPERFWKSDTYLGKKSF
ncbi:MAG: reductive dehalogenase [Promethearchaeota archaeon]